MLGDGDRGVHDFESNPRHHAHLKYRGHGAALLALHPAQNALYLTGVIQPDLPIAFVSRFLLKRFQFFIACICNRFYLCPFRAA